MTTFKDYSNQYLNLAKTGFGKLRRNLLGSFVMFCLAAFGVAGCLDSETPQGDQNNSAASACDGAGAAMIAGCRLLYTTAGALNSQEAGKILAHDHMFVEFINAAGTSPATPEQVNAVIGPLVVEARDLGYGVFVDPTPAGVNRRPDIIAYVADQAGLPAVLATGIYHEPNVPVWALDATVEEIRDWMLEELNVGVADTGVQAGFIKVSQSWGGITEVEDRILQAACEAQKETNAAIGSHILQGFVAIDTIDRLESYGCSADRFIWIHAPYTAQWEGIVWLHLAAERGAFISHDFIGSNFWAPWLDGINDDETQIEWLQSMIDAGYEDQILIGQDSGWFDPQYGPTGELPGAFDIQGFNHIVEVFLPKLEAAGFSEDVIRKLMQDNPFFAYSR